MKYISAILVLVMLCGSAYAQKLPSQEFGAIEKSKIHFFPNPATTTITFEFSMPIEKGFNLQVYSFLGRQVVSVPVNASRVSLNVSDYFRGVYVFQLRDANGRVLASNKFQVSR